MTDVTASLPSTVITRLVAIGASAGLVACCLRERARFLYRVETAYQKSRLICTVEQRITEPRAGANGADKRTRDIVDFSTISRLARRSPAIPGAITNR